MATGSPESKKVTLPSEAKKEVRPSIPGADRYQKEKVFLERADSLKKGQSEEYQLVIGNVLFRKGDMFMYCDSAHFYDGEQSMLEAYGNVRMEQGDTLFVYADELDYDGVQELAILYADPGKKVILINRDVRLETDVFEYDLAYDLGYYNVGGVLTDAQNRLESLEGEYSPTTKDANFYLNVHLNNVSDKDTLDIYTDSLFYNTTTHIAELTSPSIIVNADATIFTRQGTYNTDNDVADLYSRSLVKTTANNTLEGDTLFYDRATGYGEAFGNMVMVDSARQMTMKGEYGFYNEIADSSFVTGKALALEYSHGDTLYLHGDSIRSFIVTDTIGSFDIDSVYTFLIDTTHVMIANPRVRFYRSDMQGLCDSLAFREKDSVMYMYRHPILWSGTRQIFGNVIQIHFNDSVADWARLPEFGFSAEHIDEEFYDQLSGKEMFATFEDNNLKHLDVSGNVQAIFLPQETDSTYNKIGTIESSFLSADFDRQQITRMKVWDQSNGTLTPLYLAKRSTFYLPQFKWYEILRPKDPMDVYNEPPEMVAQLNSAPTGRQRLSSK